MSKISSEIRQDEGFGGRRLVTVGFYFTVTTLMGLSLVTAVRNLPNIRQTQ